MAAAEAMMTADSETMTTSAVWILSGRAEIRYPWVISKLIH
jgi:hypothetical protein